MAVQTLLESMISIFPKEDSDQLMRRSLKKQLIKLNPFVVKDKNSVSSILQNDISYFFVNRNAIYWKKVLISELLFYNAVFI